MMAKCRTLELSLISAENLKQVDHLSRMKVYALVSVSGHMHPKQPEQRTDTDLSGGCNPSWGSTLRFPVPAGDPCRLTMRLLLRTERALGDRDVGQVTVPLRELLATAAGDHIDANVAKRVTYPVRDLHSEKSAGVISFSYRLSAESVMPCSTPVAVQPETARRRDEDREDRGLLFWGMLILEVLGAVITS